MDIYHTVNDPIGFIDTRLYNINFTNIIYVYYICYYNNKESADIYLQILIIKTFSDSTTDRCSDNENFLFCTSLEKIRINFYLLIIMNLSNLYKIYLLLILIINSKESVDIVLNEI